MKRLIALILLLAIVGLSGCRSGGLFRRGARCGIPSFRIPKLRNNENVGCQNGCNAPVAQGVPIQQSVPFQQGFPLQQGVIIDSAPNTGFQTAPIEGSSFPVDGNVGYSPPVYSEKPTVASEGVFVGPEFGSVPSAP